MASSDPKTVSIVLGTRDEVPRLFAYPNNPSGVGFLEQSLEDTVVLYINKSLKRDGAKCRATRLIDQGDNYELTLVGTNAVQFGETIKDFIAAGKLALAASKEINASEHWAWNWRFYLPLGVAMRNTLSVELLHFPPDYTIEKDQDYLLARTLIRWGACIEAQGVPADQIDRYQTTLDIMPIGAPSDAGREIDEAVGRKAYSAYARDLLVKWSKKDTSHNSPLISFGSTVKDWLEQEFGLEDLSVGDVGTLDIDGTAMPYIIANHPSYFYNAIDEDLSDEENYAVIFPIMLDDLITARWQVHMNADPQPDPAEVYEMAREYYTSDGNQDVCEQVWIQGFGKTPEEAQEWCGTSVRTAGAEKKITPSEAELKEKGINPEKETDRLIRFANKRKAALGL